MSIGIHNLPKDLMELICTHLTPTDFGSLWKSSSHLNLGRHNLTLEAYKETKHLPNQFYNELPVTLTNLCHEKIDYLLRNEDYFNLERVMKATRLEERYIQKIFAKASCVGNEKILTYILSDRNFDPTFSMCLSLRNACTFGNKECVELMLTDNRFKSIDIWEELADYAILENWPDILELGLKNIDHQFNQQKLCQDALYKTDPACLFVLLNDPRINPGMIDNVFPIACRFGSLSVIQYLLNHPDFNPIEDSPEALTEAIRLNKLDIVDLLLSDNRIDPTYGHNEAIMVVCNLNYHWTLKKLMAHPLINPSDQNNYAIRLASQRGHFECISMLLQDPRVDPTVDNFNPLKQALRNSYFDCYLLLSSDYRTRLLLENKAELSTKSKTSNNVLMEIGALPHILLTAILESSEHFIYVPFYWEFSLVVDYLERLGVSVPNQTWSLIDSQRVQPSNTLESLTENGKLTIIASSHL